MRFFNKIKSYFSKSADSTLDASVIDKYDVGNVLGHGSFAIVKIVTRKADGQQLACKIIDRNKNKDMEDLVRSEIDVLKTVNHPHICVLRDLIETRKRIYLISDFAAGGELFVALLNKGHFYEKDGARICRQIILALDYLHGKGIVHRDLKPENVLLKTASEDSDIMITDFGLARFSEKHEIMTTTCGTPYYVAPEILLQTGYSFPCDLWSLGVGTMPFASADDDVSNFILYAEIKKGKYSFPDEFWKDISQEAKDFVSALLIVNPENRLTSSGALNHPWLSTQSTFDVLPNVRKNFNAKKTFKKAVKAVQSAIYMDAKRGRSE